MEVVKWQKASDAQSPVFKERKQGREEAGKEGRGEGMNGGRKEGMAMIARSPTVVDGVFPKSSGLSPCAHPALMEKFNSGA